MCLCIMDRKRSPCYTRAVFQVISIAGLFSPGHCHGNDSLWLRPFAWHPFPVIISWKRFTMNAMIATKDKNRKQLLYPSQDGSKYGIKHPHQSTLRLPNSTCQQRPLSYFSRQFHLELGPPIPLPCPSVVDGQIATRPIPFGE